MATRSITKQELARQESIQFIRPQNLIFSLSDARPSTRMWVFFGGVDVTGQCSLVGNTPGSAIITDANGSANIQFYVQAKKFNTGDVEVVISETNNPALLDREDLTFGSARAVFKANGRLDVIQKTVTTTVTVQRPIPIQRDPLAQSFFTYGVKGGCFITSIDLFFMTRDENVPVRVEIRPLVNGYPASGETGNPNMVSSLPGKFVKTSNDASIPTRFEFNPPVQLKEDGEYCFVVMANSQKFQVYTSRMGEKSIEDGRGIFEQPYVGSLFKSENNVTWTAEQFEDIKFTMRKANFDTAKGGKIRFAVDAPYLGMQGKHFSTVSGSNRITYRHSHDHGLTAGSYIDVIAGNGYVCNGIPAASLSGEFEVLEVPDSKTVVYQIDTTATETGLMAKTDQITHLELLSGGSGYTDTDVVQFIGGGGSGAAATIRTYNGSIVAVDITSNGSGYTSEPSVVIVSSTGSGAQIVASTAPGFSVLVNKPFEGFGVRLSAFNSDECTVRASLYTTTGTFIGGNLPIYSADATFSAEPNIMYSNVFRNLLLASRVNESRFMNGAESAVVELEFVSKNKNVSPYLDARQPMAMKAYHSRYDAQIGEKITSTNSSGSVSAITITNGGTGYATTPSVVIDAPQLVNGVQATATATITAGVVTAIDITNVGSGYTKSPVARIVPGAGDNTGTSATVQVTMTEFNTELLHVNGTDRPRYITKINRLQIVSNGVRLFSTIYSEPGSSVDWYIRSSLSSSGVDHESLGWQYIPCNIERNRSSGAGDFKEYEFRLDQMQDYDTYDLKCVFRSENPVKTPVVQSYRVIALA